MLRFIFLFVRVPLKDRCFVPEVSEPFNVRLVQDAKMYTFPTAVGRWQNSQNMVNMLHYLTLVVLNFQPLIFLGGFFIVSKSLLPFGNETKKMKGRFL